MKKKTPEIEPRLKSCFDHQSQLSKYQKSNLKSSSKPSVEFWSNLLPLLTLWPAFDTWAPLSSSLFELYFQNLHSPWALLLKVHGLMYLGHFFPDSECFAFAPFVPISSSSHARAPSKLLGFERGKTSVFTTERLAPSYLFQSTSSPWCLSYTDSDWICQLGVYTEGLHKAKGSLDNSQKFHHFLDNVEEERWWIAARIKIFTRNNLFPQQMYLSGRANILDIESHKSSHLIMWVFLVSSWNPRAPIYSIDASSFSPVVLEYTEYLHQYNLFFFFS